MKRIFVCLFVVTSILCAKAQGGDRLHFGVEVNPGVSWLIFDDPELSPTSKSAHGVVTGRAHYDISKRFQVYGGAGFRLLNVDQVDYKISFGCDHDGNGGYDPFHSWVTLDYSNVYLSIPVGLKWRLSQSQNSFYFRVGVSAEIFLFRDGDPSLYECGLLSSVSSWPAHDVKPFLFLGQGGFGYELKLREKLTLHVEPTISYSFGDVYETSFVVNNSRFLTAGLAVGLMFH